MIMEKREQFRIKIRAQQLNHIFKVSRRFVTVKDVQKLLMDDKLNELEELTLTASIGLIYEEGGANYFYQKFDSDDYQVQDRALKGLLRLCQQFPMHIKKLVKNQFASELLSEIDQLNVECLHTRLQMLGTLAPMIGTTEMLKRISMVFYKYLHSEHDIIISACLNGLLEMFSHWEINEQKMIFILISQIAPFLKTKYDSIVLQLIILCLEDTKYHKDILTEIDFIMQVPRLLRKNSTQEAVVQILQICSQYTIDHIACTLFLESLKELLEQNNLQVYSLIAVLIFRSDTSKAHTLIAILDLVYFLEDIDYYQKPHFIVMTFIKQSCDNFFTYTMKQKLDNMALRGSNEAARLLHDSQCDI